MGGLEAQKRMAAELLKCGVSRVRIKSEKEVKEAITREDVRRLIRKGVIYKVQKKGTSRAFARKKLEQKRKGRRKGQGSRKGAKKARKRPKDVWMGRIRALRKLLRELKEKGKLEREEYKKLYLMAKGGAFRTKRHLLLYLKKTRK